MRVLQLIDSLRPGGAERMAVSYANALNRRIDASHLCCTRMEGMLQERLNPGIGYIYLKKRNSVDIRAFKRLRIYIKKNKINLIQAHSSSVFLAVLVKMSLPGVKVVWHDHFGRDLKERKAGVLKPVSRFFDGIISVNAELADWSKLHLLAREVRYFRNFLPEAGEPDYVQEGKGRNQSHLQSSGRGEDFKIICVANLRPQKDHLNLLNSINFLQEKENLSLHLVGADEKDEYSKGIKMYILHNNLEKKVFIYGAQDNIEEMVKEADLGILSSSSEGLPVTLLEYGRAGLPVVCTRVGQCGEVVGENGKLVPAGNPQKLAEAISFYMNDPEKRKQDAGNFQERVFERFSEEAVVPGVISFFTKIQSPGTIN